jgi:uroporphyrin-3 C-methyltransferase
MPEPAAAPAATAAPTPAASAAPAVPASPPGSANPDADRRGSNLPLVAAAVVGAVAVAAAVMAWNTQQRVRTLEQELARRQQDVQGQSAEARALARQAQDSARDAAAKVALLEARVAESSLQRTQLEELIQSMSRSRDENMLADLDAALRVAVQQSALTGSTEPLMTALRQGEERLARANQPRLERVRRAVARDIDRVKAVGLVDIPALTLRLDEAMRLVDEAPLLSQPEKRVAGDAVATAPGAGARAPVKPGGAASAAAAPAAAAASSGSWADLAGQRWQAVVDQVWREARALVRVTRIDNPEAMLVSPEQAWYLRENLKLRLLNARLALMSRQFDSAQNDLRDAQAALDRYFDAGSRRTGTARELVQQVAQQARLVSLPRPDETLSAITAVQAGR